MRWFRQRVELLRELHHLEAHARALASENERLRLENDDLVREAATLWQTTFERQSRRDVG